MSSNRPVAGARDTTPVSGTERGVLQSICTRQERGRARPCHATIAGGRRAGLALTVPGVTVSCGGPSPFAVPQRDFPMFEPEELSEVRRLAAVARLEGRSAEARVLEGLAAKLDALAGGAPGAGTLALVEEVLPAAGAAPAPGLAARVRRAIDSQEPIRIRYRANRSGEITTRRIRPFNVHFYDGQEYVEAFCELRGSDRIFALGNIQDVIEEEGAAADDA